MLREHHKVCVPVHWSDMVWRALIRSHHLEEGVTRTGTGEQSAWVLANVVTALAGVDLIFRIPVGSQNDLQLIVLCTPNTQQSLFRVIV